MGWKEGRMGRGGEGKKKGRGKRGRKPSPWPLSRNKKEKLPGRFAARGEERKRKEEMGAVNLPCRRQAKDAPPRQGRWSK